MNGITSERCSWNGQNRQKDAVLMNAAPARLNEIRTLLEERFGCDLAGITLDPSLSLGHDGLGLDSLMITDLLVTMGARYSVEPDATLFENVKGVTIQHLLQMMSGLPRQ